MIIGGCEGKPLLIADFQENSSAEQHRKKNPLNYGNLKQKDQMLFEDYWDLLIIVKPKLLPIGDFRRQNRKLLRIFRNKGLIAGIFNETLLAKCVSQCATDPRHSLRCLCNYTR